MLIETLDNGLEVVLKNDSSTHIASIQVWVKTGSLHETESERGLAHVLEHMVFKGTESLGPGEMALKIEAFGGDVNAYTTFDRTVYYANLPSGSLASGAEVLLDSLINPTFDEQEFSKEKEVILEEIKRGLDNPSSKIGYKLFESAYLGSEAARPVIGDAETVSSFTRDDLLSFHSRWYVPNNMTVVVAGNFDVSEVFDLIKKFFAGRPKNRDLKKFVTPELQFTSGPGVEVHLLKDDHKNHRVEIALPGTELESFDSAMLDLAAFALGSGDSSRLVKNLKHESNLVAGISSSAYSPSFPGLFTVTSISPKENFLESISKIGEELKKLVTSEPVTQGEINKARAALKADRIYRDEQVEGQAKALGFGMQTTYKVHFDAMYNHQIDIAEPAEVSASVRKCLDLSSAKIVAMVPSDSGFTAEQISTAFENSIKGYETDVSDLIDKYDDIVDPEPVNTMFELSNGVKVIYRQRKKSQQVSLHICSHGGLRLETEQDVGIHNLVSGLLAEQSIKYSNDEILEIVEGTGVSLAGFSGKDSVGMSLHCLADQLDEIMPVFTDCFINPVFPENQLRSMMMELGEVIVSHNDSPSSKAMRRFSELLFPEDHPYRFPSYGTLEALASMTPDLLSKYYNGILTRGPWVVSAVGSENLDIFKERLEKSIGKFEFNEKKYNPPADKIKNGWEGQTEHISIQREQTHVVLGFRGISWSDERRPALDVIINILGGHGGRMFTNMREKASLAYSVSPVVSYGVLGGAFGGYIACSHDKTPQAVEMMKKEFIDIVSNPPSESEIERAKAYIIGQHEMDMQRPESQASTMCLMELYGVGFDDFLKYPRRVAEVTAEDVKAAAESLFVGKEPICVTCGQ